MLEYYLPPSRSNLLNYLGIISAGCVVIRTDEPQAPIIQPGDWNSLARHVQDPFADEAVLGAMYSVAEQLNPDLVSYDLIIGDDTSGRLPALLYRRLINDRRREQNLPGASTRFVNGRFYYEFPSGLLPPASTDTSRALIVTESVCSGDSIMRIYDRSSKQRDAARLDVATVGTWKSNISLEPGSRFIVGSSQDIEVLDSKLYDRSDEARARKGVTKIYGPLHSKRLAKGDFDMQRVGRARKDIALIADHFGALLSKR